MRTMASLVAGLWCRAAPCRAPRMFLSSAAAKADRTRATLQSVHISSAMQPHLPCTFPTLRSPARLRCCSSHRHQHISHNTMEGMRSWRHIRNLRHCTTAFYSTLVPSDEVSVFYKHGLPVINVVLPSRKERCQFIVKPMIMTVGNFLQDIQKEDKGIGTASICTTDGVRYSANTLMEIVLRSSFKLLINDTSYQVEPPLVEQAYGSREHATQLDDIRDLVQTLYTALHLEDHQLKKERKLLEKMDSLQEQLQPLERMKFGILQNAQAKTTRLMWVGLALLSTQGGALAWLTWWVYSWDIMEPVTYFITYGSAIAFYAYFVLTKQDYAYPEVKDRQCLNYFYKKAKKQQFDVEQYNKLKEDLAEAEANLRRLREPLQLKLPIQQLNTEH